MTGFFKTVAYFLLGPKVPLSEVTRINAGTGFRDATTNRGNTSHFNTVYAEKRDDGQWYVITNTEMRTQGRQDHTPQKISEGMTGKEAVIALRRAAENEKPPFGETVHVKFTPCKEDSRDGKTICLDTAEMRVRRESFGDEPGDRKEGLHYKKPSREPQS